MDQNQPQAVLEIPIRLLAPAMAFVPEQPFGTPYEPALALSGERFSPLSTSPSSERGRTVSERENCSAVYGCMTLLLSRSSNISTVIRTMKPL